MDYRLNQLSAHFDWQHKPATKSDRHGCHRSMHHNIQMSKTYTTIQGDMWDSIAFSQLGSEAYTDRLMNLNPQYLGYYTFPAGIVLKLPDPAEDVGDALPPWKQVVG